jgi:hypothetical protein
MINHADIALLLIHTMSTAQILSIYTSAPRNMIKLVLVHQVAAHIITLP